MIREEGESYVAYPVSYTHLTAWQQYTDWQKEDKKIVKRINELSKSIDRDGLLEGIGKPEPLKHRKVCSRRITDEHRNDFFNPHKTFWVGQAVILQNGTDIP